MRVRTIGWLAAIMVSCLANTVSAQDDSKVGITMGYPAAIGVVWHVTDGIALRPEVTLIKSSGESILTSSFTIGGTTTTTTSVITNDNWQAGIGLSAIFYLIRHDSLRTYVSPRWAYTRVASSSASSGTTMDSTANGNLVSGSFGAQYALGARFSVFGEVGVAYSKTVSTPAPSSANTTLSNTTASTLSARSGAGVILYF